MFSHDESRFMRVHSVYRLHRVHLHGDWSSLLLWRHNYSAIFNVRFASRNILSLIRVSCTQKTILSRFMSLSCVWKSYFAAVVRRSHLSTGSPSLWLRHPKRVHFHTQCFMWLTVRVKLREHQFIVIIVLIYVIAKGLIHILCLGGLRM